MALITFGLVEAIDVKQAMERSQKIILKKFRIQLDLKPGPIDF